MNKYRLLIVFVALSASSIASAAGCDLDQSTYFERLSEFSRLQCHESKPEFVKETKIVEAGLKGADKKQEAQYARALQVMASVQIAVQSLAVDGVLPTVVSQQLAQEISSNLEEARLELSQLHDGSLQIDGVTAWWPSRWMVGGSSSEDTWFLLQKSLNDQNCMGAVTPMCDEIFDGHMNIARYVAAMDVVSDFVLMGPQLNVIQDDPPPPPPGNVDRLLDEMEFGTIAFNAPTNINIDDSPQIQLILSLGETIQKLKQSIIEEGDRVGATIKVSDEMEARLSGYMFQITAITPEIQAVSNSQQTQWKWEIHPKDEGIHQLHLTLSALLEINGHSTPRAIRTFSNVIEVNVTATQKFGLFLENNWQWLWAAILVPIAGWLWKRKKKQLTNTSS